ncbi:WAT1-related protein [Acorus calamus]|uniref:WAT1-related protein n=1 Tax=Acorus calamus TaxID=4465 RepID=A0AAV9EEP4_ACOCL|nr:WAT1-related protein [Acorus calamus]
METVRMKRASGIAKLAGVALCVVGALTIAFYRGPSLKSFNHHYISSHHNNNRPTTNAKETWIEGAFFMLLCATSWSMWLVFQGSVMEEYPSKLFFATILCLCSALQTFVVALVFERDYSRWMLGFDINLIAVAYCGIFVSGLVLYLQGWCIEKRGPVFYAMSAPLTFIITIVGSSFTLGERINLGSVLGGTFMVGGLYSVLWGKSKDQKEKETMAASPFESL